MKNTRLIKTIALFMVISILTVAFMGGCKNKTNSKPDDVSGTVSGNNSELQNSNDESNNSSGNSSGNSSVNKPSKPQNTEDKNNSSTNQSTTEVKISDMPTVTVGTQVAPGVCIVAGSCPKGTEYITVKGDGVTTTKIVPFAGKTNDYYMGQVEISKCATVEVTAKEKGKAESYGVYRYVNFNAGLTQNYMEAHEYRPVIGLNSRAHFYSALLSYTLSSSKITPDVRSQAQTNIKNLVNKASSVGAETIFLIIPSSAQIYPETVPTSYKKASGETIYQAFEKIATQAGAKVIYPLDTMKKHKNDGKGYQLYQYTDSHWSTYGAYWGTYDLFNYIAKTHPAAKPRTVKEMGFYTTEMYGGDAVFNFPYGIGFDSDTASGITSKTKIKELTTLYNLKTSSNTLSSVYHNNSGLYLTNDNAAAKTVYNNAAVGLPNAVIMRDSFGKVAFDMVSDRFATACWGEFDNYNFPKDWENTNPDYVIHLYSERNLFKIMLANSSASIVGFK
ncbi:MAG: hypothetical protein IJD00_04525 [Clostridia bacterium]|nr:hypothetical protein [Clostridia bacterium]